jgi:hypothetical protein
MPQNRNQLLLQINMEGRNDFIEDEIKFGEDHNDQLSSTLCAEQGAIKVEEDPNDNPFCIADVTQKEFKVEDGHYDQLSTDVCVEQVDIKGEEDPLALPFCVADVTQEEVNVQEEPYDVYVKQGEDKVEEGPSDQLSSAACVKHSDKEEW